MAMIEPAPLVPVSALELDHIRGDQLAAWSRTVSLVSSDQRIVDFTFRFLTPNDLSSLLELQDVTRRRLTNPHLFRTVPTDRHEAILHGRGCTAGAFVDGQLVAYGAMQFPVAEENQGRAIGVTETELSLVSQFEGTVVAQPYRGFHLPRRLTEMRFRYARHLKSVIAVATISPFNAGSLLSLLPTGLLVKGLREGAGSMLRYYVSTDLRFTASPIDDDIVEVPTSDLTTQKLLLANGYWGTRALRTQTGIGMQYRRMRLVARR